MESWHLWILSTVVGAVAWFLRDTREGLTAELKDHKYKLDALEREAQRAANCKCEEISKEINGFKDGAVKQFVNKTDFERFEDRIEGNFRDLAIKLEHYTNRIFQKLDEKMDKK
jgi:hypothetical protein